MTVGSQVSDRRKSFSGSCGTALVGEYFSRTWNGANAVSVADRLNPHPYTCTISSSYDPQIEWTYSSIWWWYTGSLLSCYGGPSFPNPWNGNDDLKLLGKLSTKIRGNDFNGDAFIAEGHQTLALLSSTAQRLGGFLESIRHGNLYRASKYLGGPQKSRGSKILNTLKKELTPDGKSTGSLANAILEVQYGWRPLLQDAHEFGQAIAHVLTKAPVQTYRVQRKIAVNGISSNGGCKYNTRHTKLVRLIVTIEQEPATRQILHMNDPLAAAWEMTPWSFIADWFLPIGDYLSALNLYRECKLKSIVRTEVVQNSAGFGGSQNTHTIKGGDKFFMKTKTINRSLPSVSPRPTNIPLPHFKELDKVFSPEHCLNAFALLSGTASRFNNSLKF